MSTAIAEFPSPNSPPAVKKPEPARPRAIASKLKAKSPALHEPTKPKILIFGPPGVGKTWFSLDFPACYYIDTEAGAARTHYMDKLTKSGGMVMGPEEGALDFDTVIGQLQALTTEKHAFKTVVIDSISKLYNVAIAMEAARLGDKDVFGASKKPAIAAMRQLVNWINRMDMNVILISHQKEEWGQDAKGDRVQIGHTFDAWDKLAYELDLAVQVAKQGPTRVGIVKKSRLVGFPDNDRFEFAYPVFAERYGKDIIEKAPAPVELASADQVSEIVRLVDLIKLPEEEVQKWHNKAGVATWAEMSSDQAKKIISHIQNKITPAAAV